MENVEKATRMRKAIAKNMVNSWQTSAKCDFLMKINAQPMMDFRKRYNIANEAKVSYLNLVMKATAIALREFPYVNSSYNFETHEHIFKEQVNVGFAISLENNGLIVTNVKDTDKMNLSELSDKSAALVDDAKNQKIQLDDIQGGSITINNMGKYKRLIQHTAIINQPELAILSMYNIADEPVVKDGYVFVGKCMNLMLSSDHRVIDGEMACAFLSRIVELLENPESLA